MFLQVVHRFLKMHLLDDPSDLRLAYIKTANSAVDAVSRAGLDGLTAMLNRRTAVETADPLAVDIESDDLIFFPLLYWPVTAEHRNLRVTNPSATPVDFDLSVIG